MSQNIIVPHFLIFEMQFLQFFYKKGSDPDQEQKEQNGAQNEQHLGVIPLKSLEVQKIKDLEVYPGGNPIGLFQL